MLDETYTSNSLMSRFTTILRMEYYCQIYDVQIRKCDYKFPELGY